MNNHLVICSVNRDSFKYATCLKFGGIMRQIAQEVNESIRASRAIANKR